MSAAQDSTARLQLLLQQYPLEIDLLKQHHQNELDAVLRQHYQSLLNERVAAYNQQFQHDAAVIQQLTKDKSDLQNVLKRQQHEVIQLNERIKGHTEESLEAATNLDNAFEAVTAERKKKEELEQQLASLQKKYDAFLLQSEETIASLSRRIESCQCKRSTSTYHDYSYPQITGTADVMSGYNQTKDKMVNPTDKPVSERSASSTTDYSYRLSANHFHEQVTAPVVCSHFDVTQSIVDRSFSDATMFTCQEAICDSHRMINLCLNCGAQYCDDHVDKHVRTIKHCTWLKTKTLVVWCHSCKSELPFVQLSLQKLALEEKQPSRKESSSYHGNRSSNESRINMRKNIPRHSSQRSSKSRSPTSSPLQSASLGKYLPADSSAGQLSPTMTSTMYTTAANALGGDDVHYQGKYLPSGDSTTESSSTGTTVITAVTTTLLCSDLPPLNQPKVVSVTAPIPSVTSLKFTRSTGTVTTSGGYKPTSKDYPSPVKTNGLKLGAISASANAPSQRTTTATTLTYQRPLNVSVASSLNLSYAKTTTSTTLIKPSPIVTSAPKHRRSRSFDNGIALCDPPPFKGITNLGLTCYFGAAVQGVRSIPGLNNLQDGLLQYGQQVEVQSKDKESRVTVKIREKDHGTVSKVLIKTIQNVSRKPKYIGEEEYSPTELFSVIKDKYKNFHRFKQSDAHELLRCLLDAVRTEEISKTKDAIMRSYAETYDVSCAILETVLIGEDKLKYKAVLQGAHKITTYVDRVIGGELLSVVICKQCNHRTELIEPFLDISLPISENECTTLERCFNDYTSWDTLDGDNKFICTRCSGDKMHLRPATKQLMIQKLPPVLILHLKRFKIGYFVTKNSTHVTYPKRMDVSDYCTESLLRSTKRPTTSYSLFAIVVHSGTLNFGHYVAYVMDRDSKQWYEANDSSVKAVEEGEVLRREAYLLFYHQN